MLRGRHALVVLLSAVVAGGAGCGSAQEAVSVFPAPGTRTASPRTQIAVRGARLDGLDEPRVTGSASGVRRGRWVEHPDHRGTSFQPEEPFRPGERVTVRLGRSVNGTGGEEVHFSISGVARARPARPSSRPRARCATSSASHPGRTCARLRWR